MKQKILLLILALLGLVNTLTFAQNQQKTAYEKKVSELTIKYFSICYYGYNKPLTWAEKLELEMFTNGEEASSFILGLGIINYLTYHTEAETKKLISQITNDYKKAEKLKTSVDFKREKEAKQKKERLEKEKKLKETQKAFLKTDKGSIYNSIKTHFEEWNHKGEFEKEADYKGRVSSQSKKAFDKICIEEIKKEINTTTSNLDYNFKREISTYNSEEEYFNISFTFNGITWHNKFFIPISNAAEFSKNWEKLEVSIDNKNWCFVEDKILPTHVNLQQFETFQYTLRKPIKTYSFPYTHNNQTEITIEFDNLNLSNEYLNGYIFKFSDINLIEESLLIETKRLDSLELLTYNKKLDSVFHAYNTKLLNNPYNTVKEKMTEYNKVEINDENRNISFKNNLQLIQSKFEIMNNNFKRKLKNQNPSEYCDIYYSLNPAIKEEADKQYIECRCIYPQRVDFDINFIERKLNSCNCREKEFQKDGNLFLSKEEFDSFYNKGDDILKKEIETRILKKEEEIAIYEITINASIIKSLNFKGIKTDESGNKTSNLYFLKINNYKNKPYYSKVVDVLIENNKELKKEWGKKGELFTNKIEFYEAFTSGNYKGILKEKKKLDNTH